MEIRGFPGAKPSMISQGAEYPCSGRGYGIGTYFSEACNPKTSRDRIIKILAVCKDEISWMIKGSDFYNGYKAVIEKCEKRLK